MNYFYKDYKNFELFNLIKTHSSLRIYSLEERSA